MTPRSFALLPAATFALIWVASADDKPPQEGAAARVAWTYTAGGKDGNFQVAAGKEWVEITPDGAEHHFEEVGRTDAAVELLDKSRMMRVRLFADHMEWRRGENPQWNRLHTGRWVAAAAVPKPARPDYRVRLAYFVPTDRTPTADYDKKIRVVMHFVSEVYRQDYEARKIASPGLRFETKDGLPVVHLVRGARPAEFYNDAPKYDAQNQWKKIIPELPAAVGVPGKNLIVVFAETYDPGPWKYEWPGGVALGGRVSAAGGVGLFSAWILRPEFCATTVEEQKKLFFDTTPVKGRIAHGHGRMDSPRFEFIEDGFGAVVHELGHAMGLPHDTRRDDLDIMGNGFRNLRFNFTPAPDPARRARFSDDNARILYTSRYLAPDPVLTDRAGPVVKLSWAAPPKVGDTKLRVAVTASDDRGLRAAAFYSGPQGSVVGGRELTGKQAAFEQVLDVRPVKAGAYRLTAYVADVGGNLTTTDLTAEVK